MITLSIASQARGNLVTVASVVGGIAAQEAMKAVTHHMTPLNQVWNSKDREMKPQALISAHALVARSVDERESEMTGHTNLF